MSKYYTPKRLKGLFNPRSTEPFKVSRSKLELFLNCPRCFYLDRRHGVAQPPSFPFTLNSAVDHLLKKEFDEYRRLKKPHPLMTMHGIDAIPYEHVKLDEWRDSLRAGISYYHEPTNLILHGGIDDIWVDKDGKIIIADYKATAKATEVTLDAEWQESYKRQMEVYQWLFKKNGFDVCDTGYFVYCNGDLFKEKFGGKLEFSIKIIPYRGVSDWIPDKLFDAYRCLQGERMPDPGFDCDFCRYRAAVEGVDRESGSPYTIPTLI